MIQFTWRKFNTTSIFKSKNYKLFKMDEKMQLKDLCSYCFDTILASLQNNEKNKPSFPREFTGVHFYIN